MNDTNRRQPALRLIAGLIVAALSTAGTQALAATEMNRYEMANQCWAIQSLATGKFLAANEGGYAATADESGAEPFYLKPSALGKYMLYPTSRQLLAVSGGNVSSVARADASPTVEWVIKGAGDTQDYPPTPLYHTEMTAEEVQRYYNFRDQDAQAPYLEFTIEALSAPNSFLAADSDGALTLNGDGQTFSFAPAQGCEHFPEAESNFSGTPFNGVTNKGNVVGHVDAHVHISATEFLGGAEHGRPYHPYGVEHALSDCKELHGENGVLDVVGSLLTEDTDGHATAGYPRFTEWPGRSMLTHEAIYWKWLERSWAAGLRVIVNDLVDNETLCELQRGMSDDKIQDCNSMNNAGRQASTMYGMMDYIDAQYGGRGKGFFQIVHDARKAREVIAAGKAAVILGIEISNLFDCKVFYNPLRQQQPFEETGEGGIENHYGCDEAHIQAQIERAWGWGVRQLITIHEFDNAFGGNGIFDGLVLNLGNRENSGLQPSGDLQRAVDFMAAGGDPGQVPALLGNANSLERPTGEWWTTYDCPKEDETEGFSGYLWGSSGGDSPSWLAAPFCTPMGQGGRYGGPTPCYPQGAVPNEYDGYRFSDYPPYNTTKSDNPRQCNARWMTPIGLFTYKEIMKRGFIFDWDHLEVGMKTQLLELAEAQDITYPLVSTHGTFGGTTIDQATRLLQGGGVLYPSNGSSRGFRTDMDETYGVYQAAFSGTKKKGKPLFGFGYGTDTNGLSGQSGPRSNIEAGKEISYPFSFYDGKLWSKVVKGLDVEPVVFDQPSSTDEFGEVARTWHEDKDGNAHHGMLSDFIQEIVLEGEPEHIAHLFNAAEVYLRMWEQTQASSSQIRKNGEANEPAGVLREAPLPGGFSAEDHYK